MRFLLPVAADTFWNSVRSFRYRIKIENARQKKQKAAKDNAC